MIRIASSRVARRMPPVKTSVRHKSASPLDADSGPLATRVYHNMTTFMAVATPVVFILPDSMTDGVVGKLFGGAVAVAIAGHSWIGLNYVATDYVPKISKSLIGPARILNAGIGLVTLVGLGSIAFNGKGGIKGCVKALWAPSKKE
mmetsp:Transcript_14373/g.21072  ORF Transcript_14373/g.21072 Transcript_14373/m.21072 type:complete len:146 (-) Transcript_14373:316-753(-)|eukprot:CAMPEP_0194033076 /NCGR_PEP_ID=MMETSP0009_2-20130614/5878_1 /TAXON_ID=210454 /ORGANISM="Grammatophora oceanica, Strain CCMP 410" /LENGTH=145 /DNA_ID=CAMNT_0038673687 /DNA_START=78 /DNA_END=515 /DNA_ORIENTATION=+